MSEKDKKLKLSFHGRIIDHLGIQMYQSPIAAIAELVSNAWDADAEEVKITLPDQSGNDAKIVIEDNGCGMTFDECQNRYLKVGWCRRGNNPTEFSIEKNRPILGRKGIGKFAGFGIAEAIVIETVSKNNGEKTIFKLNLSEIRGDNDNDYVSPEDIDIETKYEKPDNKKKNDHGTKIILQSLKIRRPSVDQFSKSMARRFLLHQMVDDFKVLINGNVIPQSEDLSNVEFSFPHDYKEEEKPVGINIDKDGWGEEILGNGKKISWKINFYKLPIDEEELRGVSVFTHGKMAQKPFLFNLSGGLSGQHGQEYISGQVKANYLDEMDADIIATERQRVNWEHEASIPLLEWGKERIKSLLKIWSNKRKEERIKQLENRIAKFTQRLDKLPAHEQKTIKKALHKLAQVTTLTDDQYEELGSAVLTSWEQGRLKGLISDISEKDDFSEHEFLNILLESQVLTSLNIAEAVKTKILTVGELKLRIQKRELENAVKGLYSSKPMDGSSRIRNI